MLFPLHSLPRILYLGDVPVEASHHGSALLFRLFEGFPPDRLRIIECDYCPSQEERRLPGIDYVSLPTGRQRLLNSRFHGLYSGWLSWTAPARAARARTLLSGFDPQAIVSVAHGFGWLTAASLARALGVPFHLIVHDDWPRLSGIVSSLKDWLDRQFAASYHQACTRLCVSPSMAEAYESRYGVSGSVLYPSRSSSCPVFEESAPRLGQEHPEFVVGYGGNSNPEVILCLQDLGKSLPSARIQFSVFGPFDEQRQRELGMPSGSVTFHGLIPFQNMIHELREAADLLFMPMPFDKDSRENMIVSFPSKLADYTAIGLPILIYGPPYCSAVRWAREHTGVAEIVDRQNSGDLAAAVARLQNEPALRIELARRALEVGRLCFSHETVQEIFLKALRSELPSGARVVTL